MIRTKVDSEIAKDVKERMLSMCTHDCKAFLNFRHLTENQEHPIVMASQLNKLLGDFNKLLIACGAKTNSEQ